jgi:hypothetical protein
MRPHCELAKLDQVTPPRLRTEVRQEAAARLSRRLAGIAGGG